MKIRLGVSALLATLLTGAGTACVAPPRNLTASRAIAATSVPRVASVASQDRHPLGAPAARRQMATATKVGAHSKTATPTPTPTSRRAAGAPNETPTLTVMPKSRRADGPPSRTAIPTPRASAPSRTATPSPTHTAPTQARPGTWRRPYSWLAQTTLLTIYGRAFDTAPILGRLGMDTDFTQMDWQIQPYAQGIKANNGGTDPRIAVHLIYAMAVPCGATGNCLSYLDDTGVDIVKTYIQEAAQRHWLVILDDQLGRSDPVTEMQRIIARGYLKYDNVEVALDPEFRTQPYQPTPGIPVGTVSAAELNAAGAMLNAYAAHLGLLHRKIMMVHQFQSGMIADREELRQDLFYVDTVVVADGFGPPALKTRIYDELLGPKVSPAIHWRGIKLFPFNPYEGAGHGDFPEMTWPQVFGRAPATDLGGHTYTMRPMPNVVVIA